MITGECCSGATTNIIDLTLKVTINHEEPFSEFHNFGGMVFLGTVAKIES